MSASRLSTIRVSTGESGIRVMPETFKHRVLQLAEETVDSLTVIWREAGYEEVECHGLLGDLLHKLKMSCSAELAAEQQILEHAKQEVAAKTNELILLSEQLGRAVVVEHLGPMNYADKLAELEKLISNISAEVSLRSNVFQAELESIQALVDSLGLPFPDPERFRGPPGTPELSDVRLELMTHSKQAYESIRTRRMEDITKEAEACRAHVADLVLEEEGFGTVPQHEQYSDCDQSILKYLRTGELLFGVHKQDVETLRSRLKGLAGEKDRRREELSKTGAEIARLWTLLRIPPAERDAFQSSFKMNLSMETLLKGYQELDRLKEIRVQSLGRVIANIRSDIVVLWEEAGIVDDKHRESEFPTFFEPVDSMADSSVEEHEAYFDAIKSRVEELRPILQKVARREGIVHERIELEHIQLNSSRLTERGPHAREQRKREEMMTNHVRNLPKLTNELSTQIQTWEEINGPFMFAGERYLDRIVFQDEAFFEARETLRSAKKRAQTQGKETASSLKADLNSSFSKTSKKTDLNGSFSKTSAPRKIASGVNTPSTLLQKAKGELAVDSLATKMLSTTISKLGKVGKCAVPDENKTLNDRNSSGSEETEYTSATVVKTAESNDRSSSATVVKAAVSNAL